MCFDETPIPAGDAEAASIDGFADSSARFATPMTAAITPDRADYAVPRNCYRAPISPTCLRSNGTCGSSGRFADGQSDSEQNKPNKLILTTRQAGVNLYEGLINETNDPNGTTGIKPRYWDFYGSMMLNCAEFRTPRRAMMRLPIRWSSSFSLNARRCAGRPR